MRVNLGIVPALLLAAGVAAVGVAAAPPVTKAPRDFALRLRFGCSFLSDAIDTFRGEYVRDIGPQYAIQRTWLSFSGKEKAELNQLATDAGFFDYPEEFRPANAHAVEPSNLYELRVRSAGREHTVKWTDPVDDLGSGEPSAVRLRRLIGRIIQVAFAKPRVADLPPHGFSCL